jgi:hypothetical protein
MRAELGARRVLAPPRDHDSSKRSAPEAALAYSGPYPDPPEPLRASASHSKGRRILDHFEIDDDVVTPAGEEAFIVAVLDDGRFEVQYKFPLNRDNARVVLKGRLLRKYVPGLRLPRPVRV